MDDFSDEIHFETIRDTLQQIDLIHRLVERYEDRLAIAYRASEIMQTFKQGKIPSMVGIEGLHQIGNSSSVLRMYHKLGVRYVTLAHSRNNLYADSAVGLLSVDSTCEFLISSRLRKRPSMEAFPGQGKTWSGR